MTSSPAWRWPFPAALVAISIACSSQVSGEGSQQQAPPAQAERHEQTIEHVSPARDSVGAAPKRLVWTRVEGADQYAVGIWNEVDVLVWRADAVQRTSIDLPSDIRLEPGTYFWSVGAARAGQPIATSGLAAFVVRSNDQ